MKNNFRTEKSIIILSQCVGGIPSVAQLCKALQGQYVVTVAGPDGESGALRLGAHRGFNLFSTDWITRFFRKYRPAPAPTPAIPNKARNSYDWLVYLIRFIALAAPALIRLLLERPPSLIICVDALYLPGTRIAAALWRKPYAYVMIEICGEQDKADSVRKKKIMAWLESFGVAAATGVMVPDATWARLLRMRYKLLDLATFVIVTCPGIPENRRALSPDVTSEPLKVYYHGMFFPNRGLECLVLAMKYTQNAVLSLRGSGAAETTLRELVRCEGLTGKVIFLPPVLREELTGSAVGHEVGVTTFDGFLVNGRFGVGFKTYEYMVAGLALLVPPSRVLRPLVARTQTGLLYDFGSARSLADGINRFATDRRLVAECAKSSRRWADSTYNESVQAESIRVAVLQMLASALPVPR